MLVRTGKTLAGNQLQYNLKIHILDYCKQWIREEPLL
jgi:hypothetical protein